MPQLKPYPKYKPSNIQWIGDIPEHWSVAAVKRHYHIQLGKMLQNYQNSPTDAEVPYLKALNVQWFSVYTADAPIMWASPHEIAKFGIRAGDLLVCEGGEGGRCGIIDQIKPGYIIQNALHRVRPLGNYTNTFLQYVLSAVSNSGWFDAINNKATITHFTSEKFGALMMPAPPILEQNRIVSYLDHQTALMDSLVAKKQRMIELLTERRQSLITHAVTKGLDPQAPMRESGIQWIGDIPEHWKVAQLKHCVAQFISGGTPKTDDPRYWSDDETGIPWVAINDMTRSPRVHSTAKRITPDGLSSKQLAILPAGTLLYSMYASIGKTALLQIDATVNQAILGIAVDNDRARRDFVGYWLEFMQQHVLMLSSSNTQENLNAEKVRGMTVVLPPVAEQKDIINYLHRETSLMDALTEKLNHQIELLAERRQSLITHAVTGKIDLRNHNVPATPA